MGRAVRVSMVLFILPLLGCRTPVTHEDSAGMSGLNWPAVTRQCRPWTRWWWMGSAVDEKNLTTAMEEYKKAGLGGMEITPIYGVKGYEQRFISYLSPMWMGMLVHTLKEAEKLDLGIDMATGTGWPFGGPWVTADDACKNVVSKTFTLKAGESLQETVSCLQKPMVRAVGRRVNISELVEPVGDNKDLQALALDQVRFEKQLPLRVLMAYSDTGQVLNLSEKVDNGGKLDWVAPAGNWTLYAVFQGWHGKMVERAGPGGEGNVIDHFSAEAVKNYLSRFDKACAGYDVRSLRAYFNDSYEVDDASGQSNWTPKLFDEFKKRRGYDLRNYLPALFGSDSRDNNIRVICDYRETLSDLLFENFTIPWRQWAKSRGAIIRNQAHGSPANILDLYGASDIPETEGSDILGFKLASSAAHVTGKQLASSESATWLSEHFLATLADVKRALDGLLLGGINHVFYHGTTFSPVEEEWPGWLFYASVHFGPTNSFWSDFSALNRYVARCQSFLQAGKPDNDVLLYFPIYDRWSQPDNAMLVHFSLGDSRSGGALAQGDARMMLSRGYSFDFISDRQLAGVEVVNGSLQVGGASYKTVVLPACNFIPLGTFEKLVFLARAGATVVVCGGLPADVPGLGQLAERREAFHRLLGQISFTDTDGSGIRKAQVGTGVFLTGSDLEQMLSYAGIKRETMVDSGLQFIRRTDKDNHYYFIVNSGDHDVDGWVPLQIREGRTKSAAVFDPMLGQRGLAALRTSQTGTTEVYLQLAPGQSCIIKTFETVVTGPLYKYLQAAGEPQQVSGVWSVSFVEGGPELPPAVEMRELGSWTNFEGEGVKKFSGTARYTISFERPAGQADGWLLDLGRVCEIAAVEFNGQDLGTLIGPPYRIPIRAELMKDKNVLKIKVSNLMVNRIADMDRRGVNYRKFYNVNFPARIGVNRGSDGLFNASRWPVRDSGLLGPVTLQAVKKLAVQ